MRDVTSPLPVFTRERRGTCFGIRVPTGRHNRRTLSSRTRSLDHLIAGCVTTAAKFPSISANPICCHPRTKKVPGESPIRMATFTQSTRLEWIGGCRGDALAEMPLVKPRAQLAFKDSMIRGILQFTLRIAFRCVLHRCKSQDIRC